MFIKAVIFFKKPISCVINFLKNFNSPTRKKANSSQTQKQCKLISRKCYYLFNIILKAAFHMKKNYMHKTKSAKDK